MILRNYHLDEGTSHFGREYAMHGQFFGLERIFNALGFGGKNKRHKRIKPNERRTFGPKPLEARCSCPFVPWTGEGGNADWGNLNNWRDAAGEHVVPSAGDELKFVGTAAQIATYNDRSTRRLPGVERLPRSVSVRFFCFALLQRWASPTKETAMKIALASVSSVPCVCLSGMGWAASYTLVHSGRRTPGYFRESVIYPRCGGRKLRKCLCRVMHQRRDL